MLSIIVLESLEEREHRSEHIEASKWIVEYEEEIRSLRNPKLDSEPEGLSHDIRTKLCGTFQRDTPLGKCNRHIYAM